MKARAVEIVDGSPDDNYELREDQKGEVLLATTSKKDKGSVWIFFSSRAKILELYGTIKEMYPVETKGMDS